MEELRDYGGKARSAQKRISQELDELKESNDRERLSELYILASWSVVGVDRLISEDEDIEGIESESSEELAAEYAMWDALHKLAEVVDAVEAELYGVDDSQGVDDALPTAHKKAAERWFDRGKAS